jgi:WD40 repeat protein/serine/threonine protein kinase
MSGTPFRCPHCQTPYVVADARRQGPAACPTCGADLHLDPVDTTASAGLPVTGPPPSGDASSGTTEDGPRSAGDEGGPPSWQVGDVILGLYAIRQVHEGGMGRVYRVRHRGWDLDLAVKCPRPAFFRQERDKENFEREAETWVHCGLHPHTVSCYYVRRIEGIPLIFAEYVAGGSLAEWIRRGTLYAGTPEQSLARVLDVAIQFAWGLHHAHQLGYVHQDVKPANLLMTPTGTAKVTDFGLARARASTAETVVRGPLHSILVSSGGMTPAYCSPEQAQREPVSRRTDIWSWGVSMLELFTREVTWTGGELAGDALETYLRDRAPDAPPPRMPPAVADLLRRCFRRTPQDRPGSMLEVATELQGIFREVFGTAHPRPVPQPAQPLAANLNNRAVSLLDLGREQAAEVLWDEALRLQPLHPESTYNRGLLHWRRGRLRGEALVQQLREVCASHPGEWLPPYLLSEVHLERQDGPAAQAVLQNLRAEDAPDEGMLAALESARGRLTGLLRPSRTLEGHGKPVAAVAVTADGTRALTAGADGVLRVFDAATARTVHTLSTYAGALTRLTVAEDGELAATGGADGVVRLWDLASGECLRTCAGHDGPITALSMSDAGRLLLSGGEDNTFRLWRAATGECLGTFRNATQETEGALLCADGQWVLSVGAAGSEGGGEHGFHLWDLETGRCLRTYQGHRQRVAALSLSSDGRLALSAGWDHFLKLWDVVEGSCLRTFAGHTERVMTAALSADGKYVLSGSEQGILKFWEVGTGTCIHSLDAHHYGITCVAVGRRGEQGISASADKLVKLWPQLQGAGTAPSVLCRVHSPDRAASAGKLYARYLALARLALAEGDLASAARRVRQARAQPGYSRHAEALDEWMDLYLWLPRTTLNAAWECGTFTGHRHAVTSLALSLDGSRAVSTSKDRTLKVWDMPSGRCVETLRGHEGSVWAVWLTEDGGYALTGGQDRTMRFWDLSSGRCLRTFHGHRGAVWSVTLTSDRRHAWSASWDRTLRLWEVATGRCLRILKGHEAEVNRILLSPDERLALSASWDGTVGVWDTATGKWRQLLKGHTGPVWSACWSPDGTLALSGGEDKTLRLWDVADSRCLRVLRGHTEHVTSVAFGLDGRHALSGSWDQSVKLWDTNTGRCLRTFEGHDNRVNAVGLSADGRYALSAGDDATVRLWMLDWELEDRSLTDWDEGARSFLEVFRTLHTPYARPVPRWWVTERELTRACTRTGTAAWDDDDVQTLLYLLGCAGYGWLRPEGVRRRLATLQGERGK